MLHNRLKVLFFLTLLATPLHAQNFQAQNTLIGVTPTLQAQANGGAGMLFGIIDTGIAAPWIGFQDRIDTARSTCVIGGCSQSLAITDDNGHGTFVASQIIGRASSNFYGIAPQARAIAVKVVNANGSGNISDVANGITYAANQGAKVLNVSLTFAPTSQLISAINQAAAKGAVIVFAGGNDGTMFQGGARISGLTDQAINNLILMGSTNIGKYVSFFSTKPGTGGFTSTSGKFYSFASRWMMADGETVYGASTYHDGTGYRFATTMTGTSMAAPQASGVAGLLAARWPFLLNNGTVAQILLATTQDLGASGTDNIYGSGFLRADKAFQPVGTMTVPVFGTNIPVSYGGIQANGVINANAVKGTLASGVAFDNFKRDFPMNYAATVTNTSVNTSDRVATAYTATGGQSGRSFTDLGNGAWTTASFTEAPTGAMQDPTRPTAPEYSAGFYSKGVYMGGGRGTGSSYSFNDARWGSKTAFFDTNLAGAGNLLGLSTGTGFAAGGIDISTSERLSFGIIMGKDDTQSMLMGNEISSKGIALGYTLNLAHDLDVSFTGSYLKEKNSLLGAPSGGFLRIGEQSSSMGVGVSANYNLGHGLQLGFDASAASTNPSDNHDSLIAHTSRLFSAGYGIVLRKENLTGMQDMLVASIKSPLHVISGSADINVPVAADPETGDPIIAREKANLATSGMEMDFNIGYTRPLSEDTTAGFALAYRHDADNVAGAQDAAVMLRLTKAF